MPLLLRIPLLIFGYAFVLLAVVPWEGLWRTYKGASRPVQVTTGVAFVALVVVVGVKTPQTSAPVAQPTSPAAPDTATAESAPDDLAETPRPTQDPQPTADLRLYPDRSNYQDGDVERSLGEPVEIDGVQAVAVGVQGQGQNTTTAIAVTLTNVGLEPASVSQREWRLQTPSLRVIEPSFPYQVLPGELRRAELLPDGHTRGNLLFDLGGEVGDFYLLWEPADEPVRGVWQVSVEG